MKVGLGLILASLLTLNYVAFADNHDEKKEMEEKIKPKNIDKNNVGDTSGENADQTDPTLIEGNLENNDFKN